MALCLDLTLEERDRKRNQVVYTDAQFWKWRSKPGMVASALIPAFLRLRQEDGHELEDSLGYSMRPCFFKSPLKVKHRCETHLT